MGGQEAVVLIPNYHRPPDECYPKQRDSLVELYKRLLTLYEPEDIIVMGDSAGGNLALATVLKAIDDGCPAPAGIALISPWVDLRGHRNDTLHERCDPSVL